MLKKVIVFLFMSLFLSSAVLPQTATAVETKVYVNPRRTTGLDIGETFSIDISISDVNKLRGWQFVLYYKSSVLNAILTYDPEAGNYTQVLEGPFLKDGGETFLVVAQFTDNYNATHGRILAACLLLGAATVPPSGSGTLATVSFEAKAIGNSPLDLVTDPPEIDAGLVGDDGKEIPHITVDGSAHVGLYDIAITGISPSKTVANDTTIKIAVTVENQGETPVTSDVTLSITGNPPQIQRVTELPGGVAVVLNYTWDTRPVPLGTYILTAEAPLEGDVDPTDNTYPPLGTILTVIETIKGDINGDFTIDIYDVVIVARAFGSKPGNPDWKPNADLVEDNIIDIYDVVIVAQNFGKKA